MATYALRVMHAWKPSFEDFRESKLYGNVNRLNKLPQRVFRARGESACC